MKRVKQVKFLLLCLFLMALSEGLLAQEGTLDYEPGLVENYYLGTWTVLPNFSTLPINATRIVTNVELGIRRGDYFGTTYTGFIYLEAGTHKFQLGSDDGSKLYLNEKLTIDNDGLHGFVYKEGTFVSTVAGYFPIRVEFFENGGNEWLALNYGFNGEIYDTINPKMLYHFVNPKPKPLTIDAGPNQNINLEPCACGKLVGSVSSFEGSIKTILWSKISGPDVTIINSNQLEAILDGLKVGTYVFELIVTDSNDQQATDQITVTVLEGGGHLPPVVNAGKDITVTKGTTVTLLGIASNDSGIVDAKWNFISIPGVPLKLAKAREESESEKAITYPKKVSLNLEFLAENVGDYVLEFSVIDLLGYYSTDRVIVTVTN